MPYVMVPVPEEHEAEFMDELMQMALRASLTGWKPEAMTELLAESEPAWLDLIRELVAAAGRGEMLARQVHATALSVDLEEIISRADAINARCKERGWPYLVLAEPAEDPADGLAGEAIYVNQVASRLLVSRLEPAVQT